MAADAIEMRLARLEGSYEQVSARLGAIESLIGQMDTRIDQRISGLDTRIDQRISRLEEKVDGQFHWVVGLVLIAILVPIALRFIPVP